MVMFKMFKAVQMFLYRLTGGVLGGSRNGFRVLLLTTTGKKSGLERTTPLGYINDGKRFVLMASNIGSDYNPGWFHNLTANPQVLVQIMANHIKAVASVATGDERVRLLHDFLQQNKAFPDYPKDTQRELPLVILTPVL